MKEDLLFSSRSSVHQPSNLDRILLWKQLDDSAAAVVLLLSIPSGHLHVSDVVLPHVSDVVLLHVSDVGLLHVLEDHLDSEGDMADVLHEKDPCLSGHL